MPLDLINPKKHRQLFLDAFAVESMKGAARTLHSPKKMGSCPPRRRNSEPLLPAMEFSEKTVGMVVLRSAFVLCRQSSSAHTARRPQNLTAVLRNTTTFLQTRSSHASRPYSCKPIFPKAFPRVFVV